MLHRNAFVIGSFAVLSLFLLQGQGCPEAVSVGIQDSNANSNSNTNINANTNTVNVVVGQDGSEWLYYYDAGKRVWFPIRFEDIDKLTGAQKATLTTNPQGAPVSDTTSDGEVAPITPTEEDASGTTGGSGGSGNGGGTPDGNGTGTTIWQDADADGVPDTQDHCPGSTLYPVDTNGCDALQVDGDGDGVVDYYDMCPDTKQGTVVNTEGCDALTPIAVPDENVQASPVNWIQYFEGWIEGTGARPLGYALQTSMDISLTPTGGQPPYSYRWGFLTDDDCTVFQEIDTFHGWTIVHTGGTAKLTWVNKGINSWVRMRVRITDSAGQVLDYALTPTLYYEGYAPGQEPAPAEPLALSFTYPTLNPALVFDGFPRERTTWVDEGWLPLGSGGWVIDMNVAQNGAIGLDLNMAVSGGKQPYTVTWTWLKVIDGWIGNGVEEVPGTTVSYGHGEWALSTLSGSSTHLTWTVPPQIAGDDQAAVVRLKVSDASDQTLTRFVYPRLYWE